MSKSAWMVERVPECKPCLAEHYKTGEPLPCIKCPSNIYLKKSPPISEVKSGE